MNYISKTKDCPKKKTCKMRWRPGDTRETCEYKSTDLGVGTPTHTNTRVQI